MAAAYHSEPYLTALKSCVLTCERIKSGWRVSLSDTIFYPEGGGQPADWGRIGSAKVRDVQKEADVIWHYVDEPLSLGVVDISLDWSRRFDHMQQHTGQHLFTALALTEWGFATVGFHLGAQVVGIELDTPDLTLEVANAIADRVNEVILQSLPIQSSLIEKSDFKAHGVRSRATPENVEGPYRIVEIAGLDKNTCGGTHLSNTHELRGCLVVGIEKFRGRYRVNCLFGDRVLKAGRRWNAQEMELNRIFCQGAPVHVSIARQWSESLQNYKRRQKKLETELMTLLARQMANTEEMIVTHYRQGAQLQILSVLASVFVSVAPDKTLLLGGGVPGEGVFIIIAPQADLSLLKPQIFDVLQGSGGGKGARIQGKCERIQHLDHLLGFDFGH